jgi:hypothetical protein
MSHGSFPFDGAKGKLRCSTDRYFHITKLEAFGIANELLPRGEERGRERYSLARSRDARGAERASIARRARA